MNAIIARTLSAAYDKLSKENWDELSEAARDLHSGMGIQLKNLITDFGNVLGIEDWDQWYYDCGMRICGTPQVGICDWCKGLGAV
jgi:hypothetical protein